MRIIRVSLKERSYPISIGAGIIDSVGLRVRDLLLNGQVAVVSNSRVMRLYGRTVRTNLNNVGLVPREILIPDGERYKTLPTVEKILNRLVGYRFERSSLLIALGGGVVGDIVGFAASAYLRGISYIQIPTTVVAQVDSSVGGKTGVDHPKGKNLIGSFWQPKAVIIDPDVLRTLPSRQYRAGLAEVVKYGVIADPIFFRYLEDHCSALLSRQPKALEHVISVSCAIKARIVGSDERELSGRRMVLNFGHTFGHAIETATGYTRFLHGEAVAIGMVIATQFAVRRKLLKLGEAERIISLIRALRLPTEPPDGVKRRYLEAILRDKKVSKGLVCLVLPTRIGRAVRMNVEPSEIRRLDL